MMYSCVVAKAGDNKAFSISSADGKRVPQVYEQVMIAVLESFKKSLILKMYLFLSVLLRII